VITLQIEEIVLVEVDNMTNYLINTEVNSYKELLKLEKLVEKVTKKNNYQGYITLWTTAKLIDKLYQVAKLNSLWWHPPQIGSDSDQSISLHWYKKSNRRILDIFINGEEVHYIAYWGNKTDEEREHGNINIENNLTEFWEWIAE
jgi:hypothetical protein